MDFNEIAAELDKFKDTDDYKTYVGGLTITPDRVNQYLESEDGKKLIQPTLDKYHNKSLESWKTSSLPKLIDEEVKKKYPDADPKDLELQSIRSEMESMKREVVLKDVTNKALSVAIEKKIPQEFVPFVVTEDEKTTIKNLDTVLSIFNTYIAAAVEEKLKSNTYVPPNGNLDMLSGVEKEFYKRNPNLIK